MTDNYADITRQIEAIGCYTSDGVDRLICAARRRPDGTGLTGNSFWIAFRKSGWFLGVWGGCIYRIPDSSNVADLCTDWLERTRAEGLRSDVDDALRESFGLTPVSTDEFDSA